MSALSFLADEGCDFCVVRTLRAAGFDVVALAELSTRTEDRDVIARAWSERRVLLTEDRDFGWLVYVERTASAGVILVRFPTRYRQQLGDTVLGFVRTHEQQIPGSFVTLQPGLARISRLPEPSSPADPSSTPETL